METSSLRANTVCMLVSWATTIITSLGNSDALFLLLTLRLVSVKSVAYEMFCCRLITYVCYQVLIPDSKRNDR